MYYTKKKGTSMNETNIIDSIDNTSSLLSLDSSVLVFDEKTSTFSFMNFDSAMDSLNTMKKNIEDFDYFDGVDHRKEFKEVRSSFTKLSKAIKSVVLDSQRSMFALAQEQRTQMENAINDIQNVIDVNLNESDRKARAEKQEHLSRTAHDVIDFDERYKGLAGIDVVTLFSAEWLNRSFNLNKADKLLIDRIEEVNNVVTLNMFDGANLETIINYLANAGWNTTTAVMNKKADDEAAKQAEIIAEQARREKIENTTEYTYLTIKIKDEDRNKVINLLKDNKIDFEIA